MAYNMFRLAAILQGVMARAVAGNAASAAALDAGRRARPLAERGWAEVERMRAGRSERARGTSAHADSAATR